MMCLMAPPTLKWPHPLLLKEDPGRRRLRRGETMEISSPSRRGDRPLARCHTLDSAVPPPEPTEAPPTPGSTEGSDLKDESHPPASVEGPPLAQAQSSGNMMAPPLWKVTQLPHWLILYHHAAAPQLTIRGALAPDITWSHNAPSPWLTHSSTLYLSLLNLPSVCGSALKAAAWMF